MKKTIFKRGLSMLMAMLLCFSGFVNIGTTTAFAAGTETDAGVIPKFAGCVNGVQWFKDRGLWHDNSYEPRPGDIIFFDWNDGNGQDGLTDHVGIVEKVENGFVYTIEGNSGDSCRER